MILQTTDEIMGALEQGELSKDFYDADAAPENGGERGL